MYIISTSLKNLLRYKTRYIITGLFLLFLFSCVFCMLFYNTCVPAFIADVEAECRSEVEPQFRDELSYKGIVGFDHTVGGFNKDGSMDKYNYPVYYEKEVFEQIAALSSVAGSYINYAATVYTSEKRPFFIYGGDLESLNLHTTIERKADADEIRIIEGRENRAGECLMHVDYAEKFTYSVGDDIEYYDENGALLGKLTISGLYMPYKDGAVYTKDYNIYKGSNPFYTKGVWIYRTIVTDFDTAYDVYGAPHEFNDYLVWYKLNTDIYDFKDEAEAILNEKTLEFDWNQRRYDADTSGARSNVRFSYKLIPILIAFAAAIIAIITIYNRQERNRDFGIFYALGADKHKMTLLFSLETMIFMTILQFISTFGGKLLMYVTVITDEINDYPELEFAWNGKYILYVLIFWAVTVLFTSALSALLMHCKRTLRR